MKKVLWVLSSLALVGMGFVGCEGDDTDACDGKCDDSQICAPIKNAGSECIDAKAILDKFKTADGKALKECYVIVKQTNGDLTPEVDSAKCTNYCDADAQCDSKSCNTSTHTCNKAGEQKTEYKYVLINDQSEGTKSRDFGADIDAVVLVKGGDGAKKYAKSVAGFKRGDEVARNSKDTSGIAKENASDPEKALGAPDSLINYGGSADTDVCYYYKDSSNSAGNKKCDSDDKTNYCGGKEDCECDFDYTFVSLGGKGGYIILEMDGAIEAGDKLDIIELGGGCILSNTGSTKGKGSINIGSAGTEKMDVGISLGSEDLTSFKTIGEGVASKGILSIQISDNMFK